MVSPLLEQSKSKLVWETITCRRANKYRVQWTAILTNRGGWKTNKKLLKSCQTSEYQYASVNCTQFWWVDSSSLFQAFNYLGRSAKHDTRKKGAETRRGKSRKFVQSLFLLYFDKPFFQAATQLT